MAICWPARKYRRTTSWSIAQMSWVRLTVTLGGLNLIKLGAGEPYGSADGLERAVILARQARTVILHVVQSVLDGRSQLHDALYRGHEMCRRRVSHPVESRRRSWQPKLQHEIGLCIDCRQGRLGQVNPIQRCVIEAVSYREGRFRQLACLAETLLGGRFQHCGHVLQRLRCPGRQQERCGRRILQPRVAFNRYLKAQIAERAVKCKNPGGGGSFLLAKPGRLHQSAGKTIPETHLLLP